MNAENFYIIFRVLKCSKSPRRLELLFQAGERTKALDPPLTFTPWIVLNNEKVVCLSSQLYALLENVCVRLEPKPDGCQGVRKPPKLPDEL